MSKNKRRCHPLQDKPRTKISICQKNNEQLYKLHLECATLWPTTWQLIQSTIDGNIQQQMDNHYECLNNKLDQLLQKQPQHPAQSRHNDDRHFYTRIKNLTNINFNKEEMQLLKYGLNYSIERLATTYAANLIESAVNQCTVWQLTECDDTRYCRHTSFLYVPT